MNGYTPKEPEPVNDSPAGLNLDWMFPFFIVAAICGTLITGVLLIVNSVDSFRNCASMCGGSEQVQRFSTTTTKTESMSHYGTAQTTTVAGCECAQRK